MKRNETQSSAVSEAQMPNHARSFQAVRDTRKRKIPGLWLRGERYYAQVRVDLGNGRTAPRRIALNADNLRQAQAELERVRTERRAGSLPTTGHRPKLGEFAGEYLAMNSTRSKKQRTQNNEAQALERWKAHLGGVRIDKISTAMIKAYTEARLRGCDLGGREFAPAHARTVELDCISLRQVLKAAMDAGHLTVLPRFPKVEVPDPPRRALISPEQFTALLNACIAIRKDGKPVTLNGEQLRDFLRVLAYSGAREQETLAIRWPHVDFERRKVWIGAPADFIAAEVTTGTGGTSKNRGSREVQFNAALETTLREMHARCAPDSVFLFPSPRRGERDLHATNFRKSLRAACEQTGLPANFGFHQLRVLFISRAVMSGLNAKVIAEWVGHRDGGKLIFDTYAKTDEAHKAEAARKLNFGGAQ